jgi:hypothetical protein
MVVETSERDRERGSAENEKIEDKKNRNIKFLRELVWK